MTRPTPSQNTGNVLLQCIMRTPFVAVALLGWGSFLGGTTTAFVATRNPMLRNTNHNFLGPLAGDDRSLTYRYLVSSSLDGCTALYQSTASTTTGGNNVLPTQRRPRIGRLSTVLEAPRSPSSWVGDSNSLAAVRAVAKFLLLPETLWGGTNQLDFNSPPRRSVKEGTTHWKRDAVAAVFRTSRVGGPTESTSSISSITASSSSTAQAVVVTMLTVAIEALLQATSYILARKTTTTTTASLAYLSTMFNGPKPSLDGLANVSAAVTEAAQHFWWTGPAILLCGVVPIHTLCVYQTLPTTPAVWKLVNMEFVHTAAHAVTIIAVFLASNLSYILAAAHLLRQSKNRAGTSMARTTQPFLQSSRERQQEPPQNTLPIAAAAAKTAVPAALGWWILAAGCMSTIFHAVQAWGDYGIAEALCYLDHGVAGTATLYFWHACGAPSLRTWLWAAAGLTTLAFPITAVYPPLYPALHASWHVLSAIAALVWVQDASPERLRATSLRRRTRTATTRHCF